MTNAPKSSAKIVWTYGTICGVCFGMIYLAMTMGHVDIPGGIGGAVNYIRIITLPLSFLLVGMLASKQTGRVHTGMQAGLVAGLTEWIIFFLTVEMWRLSLASLVILVLSLAAGAMFGEMGGLAGYRSRKPLDDTTEADATLQTHSEKMTNRDG